MTSDDTRDDEVTKLLPDMPTWEPELPSGTVVGSYVIVGVLGRGGMGVVYEARHVELGRRAALKVMQPLQALQAEIRERFLREGKAASAVRHRNVVDVYDLGTIGRTPFIAMEYLEGETLSVRLRRETRIAWRQVVDLILPVLCALQAAHDLGIIHRDVKPANIFLGAAPGGGVVPKIVDFGISKMLAEDLGAGLTKSAAMLGTPHYMSPEQADDARAIDARTDQYSAAVITYEACVGQRPFDGDSLLSVLTAIVQGSPAPPRASVPDLPEALERIILQGMRKEPERRFPSAGAMARELLPFASEGVRATYANELAVDQTAHRERPRGE